MKIATASVVLDWEATQIRATSIGRIRSRMRILSAILKTTWVFSRVIGITHCEIFLYAELVSVR